MRTKSRNRIFIALLLFAIFVPVHVVKGLHHHACTEHACHSDEQPAGKHSHNDCPICHFTFSPYTLTESVTLNTLIILIQQEYTNYLAGDYSTTYFSHYLRAPPTV